MNERMYELGAAPSAIRELFAYGLARKAEIGADKVYDFSLGNPSVPAPDAIAQAMAKALELPPMQLHSYSPAQGAPACRQAIADNLNKRFGTAYSSDDLYLTMGAAAALDACITAITNPGDEVIANAPYFPEYRIWIENAGCTCVEVPTRSSDFQLDVPALAAAITPKTRAIIVNSPNNPVGTVYTRENLEELAAMLRAKEEELGQPIYLISDEPYRELAYGGAQVSWVPDIYADTLVCYSWSKSFSLPGERIGYVLVPPAAADARRVYLAVCGAGRVLGYVCAPTLLQKVIADCIDTPVNVEPYVRNRKLLTDMLDDLGYEYIEPAGAFYLWMKALEPDAQAFSDKAKGHELLIVASDSFGVGGWVRVSYCVSEETIVNSRDAFAALKADYE
ncbi:MAG: pyridoxal phosphate-dependent aminotransferase [Coriobacteriia bacterium]|nr:pyridoxal phosphate-dependent aminotransferase [Coriobacteriia bacterium]